MGRPRMQTAVPGPSDTEVVLSVAAVQKEVAASVSSAGGESEDAVRQQRPVCRIKRVQRTRSGCITCKQRYVCPRCSEMDGAAG